MGIKCIHCETKQIPVYDPLQETRKKKKKKKEEGKKKESFHIVHWIVDRLSIGKYIILISPRHVFLFYSYFSFLLSTSMLYSLTWSSTLVIPPFPPFLTPLLHAQSIEQLDKRRASNRSIIDKWHSPKFIFQSSNKNQIEKNRTMRKGSLTIKRRRRKFKYIIQYNREREREEKREYPAKYCIIVLITAAGGTIDVIMEKCKLVSHATRRLHNATKVNERSLAVYIKRVWIGWTLRGKQNPTTRYSFHN